MAWCGQNSLHLKQEQQRWLLYGYTTPSFFTKTPIEHMSMQTQLNPQRSGSRYTSNSTVVGRLTSMRWFTVPAGDTAAGFFAPARRAGTGGRAVPAHGRDNGLLTVIMIRCPDNNCGIVSGPGRTGAGRPACQ
jgi:hypothetical protein